MKILIDAHLSGNKLTGIGRYINNLVYSLLEIDKENEYFLMIRNNLKDEHPLRRLEFPNLKKIKVDFKGLSFKQHRVTPKLVKHNRVDVYHHPHFDLPLGVSVPSVVTIHDIIPFRYPEYFPQKSKLKRFYMSVMFRSALNRARKIIAISKITKNDLLEMFNTKPEKIEVIYHGINPNDKSMKNSTSDNCFTRFPITKPYILFVGERRPHKNIPRLIEAFCNLCEHCDLQLQLIIVGKPWNNYREPEIIIEQLNIEKKVLLLDYVEDEILSSLYENAEMLVLPSLYEGFGLPLLEAMEFNIPVIGANISAIPEIMDHAGLLVNPYDPEDITKKIKSILNQPSLKSRLIEAGRKRVKDFTWKKTAIRTLNIYKEVVNNSTSGK